MDLLNIHPDWLSGPLEDRDCFRIGVLDKWEHFSSGNVRMYNQCSMDALRHAPSGFWDLGIVDPPYGMKIAGRHRYGKWRDQVAESGNYRRGSWDDEIPDQEYFTHLVRVCKQVIIFGVNYFLETRRLGIGPGRIVWDKVNGATNWSDAEIMGTNCHRSTRLIPFLWNGMLQGTLQNPKKPRGDKRTNEPRIHETQKPIMLYHELVDRYAGPGFRILDTHGGSRSICHAVDLWNSSHPMEDAIQLDWFEKDPDIYSDAVTWFKSHWYNLFSDGC